MDKSPKIQRIALALTKWIGSLQSILVHTIVFSASFLFSSLGFLPFDRMLLILTTILSLEAIYLALFIQMTVNYTSSSIKEVGADIEEIQEDVGEIQEDIEEISEDVDELQENIEEIGEDVDEINEDEAAHEAHTTRQQDALATIQADLRKLMEDIERLKENR